jgi:hypothetical protein
MRGVGKEERGMGAGEVVEKRWRMEEVLSVQGRWEGRWGCGTGKEHEVDLGLEGGGGMGRKRSSREANTAGVEKRGKGGNGVGKNGSLRGKKKGNVEALGGTGGGGV